MRKLYSGVVAVKTTKKCGKHYHLCVKLDRNQRWLSSKEFLRNEYGINANYSSKHHNYYSAWTYVTKEDENFIESAGHPDLKNASEPKTSAASRAKRNNKHKRKLQTKIIAMRMIRRVTTISDTDVYV